MPLYETELGIVRLPEMLWSIEATQTLLVPSIMTYPSVCPVGAVAVNVCAKTVLMPKATNSRMVKNLFIVFVFF